MSSEEVELLKKEIAELRENQEFLEFKLSVAYASSPTALKVKSFKKERFYWKCCCSKVTFSWWQRLTKLRRATRTLFSL